MKLSQFRRIIKEEVRRALREEETGETTYVFQLYGVQVEGADPTKGGNLVKGATQVKLLNTFPGNNDGSGTKLPQPVILQRKDSIRGYAYHLFVSATPDTFSQVLTQYANANTKEFKNLSNKSILVQIPSSEVVKIQKKTMEAFTQAV